MAIRRICKYGEKILRKKTQKVDFKSMKGKIEFIIDDMFDTLCSLGGLGLSANQIGLDLSLAIVKLKDEKEKETRFILINPEITEKCGTIKGQEGCLSFPGLYAVIKRSERIRVRALNEKGLPIEINAHGLLSRVLQHEIDHLHGVLFIDKLPLMTKIRLKPVLFKLKKQWAKIDETKTTARQDENSFFGNA
jgi:peptide deformylase